jgi:hypothetical protein
MSLYVHQVSRSDTEFSTDLEGACGCQGEKGTQSFVGLWEGMWCSMGPETQGGSLALCLYHLTIHHFCVLSLVAQLSDS